MKNYSEEKHLKIIKALNFAGVSGEFFGGDRKSRSPPFFGRNPPPFFSVLLSCCFYGICCYPTIPDIANLTVPPNNVVVQRYPYDFFTGTMSHIAPTKSYRYVLSAHRPRYLSGSVAVVCGDSSPMSVVLLHIS